MFLSTSTTPGCLPRAAGQALATQTRRGNSLGWRGRRRRSQTKNWTLSRSPCRRQRETNTRLKGGKETAGESESNWVTTSVLTYQRADRQWNLTPGERMVW